ncbi:zinc-binding dehydrogenase [Mycolicibacterium sp.]|uniref:zinc-dependent alcohol dehydrogenase n=1 Tax=Mycolicibacterium sp. TaxID=2320850 RepID=UPI001A32BB1F|nr:zinc-binding dehydrogenase [Mycolicibacterium sp.]MBJ7336773.1 zinc-binding dehydrogenase [Mycolicibacterium sp.]
MTKAHVLVLEAPNRLVAKDIVIPRPAAGEAVLRVTACGLCGSDHELYSGAMPGSLPLIPGHEVVGVVENATDEFAASHGVCDGDVVALEVFQRCRECDACRRGAYPLCRTHGMKDSYGNTSISVGSGLWGGYATHLLLTADSLVHPIPTGMDSSYATLFNPLGAGVRWGQVLPGVKQGDVVAVLGPGLRGLSAVAVAAIAGARFTLLTGAGTRDHDRLKLGEKLGATVGVDITTTDAKALLKEQTGGLADVVVDVTAAAPAAFTQAIDLARPGGTVVVAGTRGVHGLKDFNPDRIVLKELTVLGARGVDGVAYARALDLLATEDRFHTLPRTTSPLDATSVAELLGDMAHGQDPPLHAVIVP